LNLRATYQHPMSLLLLLLYKHTRGRVYRHHWPVVNSLKNYSSQTVLTAVCSSAYYQSLLLLHTAAAVSSLAHAQLGLDCIIQHQLHHDHSADVYDASTCAFKQALNAQLANDSHHSAQQAPTVP
jgi:hypothetical protein